MYVSSNGTLENLLDGNAGACPADIIWNTDFKRTCLDVSVVRPKSMGSKKSLIASIIFTVKDTPEIKYGIFIWLFQPLILDQKDIKLMAKESFPR